MKLVKPRVYMIAHTAVDHKQLDAMLADIGAADWRTDADNDSELLVEVAGRLCYRSFGVGLNPNVTRVREGNGNYIGNILSQQHGSVLEHASVSFAILGCSRVFTHELVRHRIGSPSQESLRYVRLDKLTAYYPEIGFGLKTLLALWDSLPVERQQHIMMTEGVTTDEAKNTFRLRWASDRSTMLSARFLSVFEAAEKQMATISDMLELDFTTNFDVKKKITSSMRRMVPDGLGTAIIYTCNMRVLRDIIWRRTSRHAEEEIRAVFAEVYEQALAIAPALFQDASEQIIDGTPEVIFANLRV